jgi:hypothetical protein
MGLGLIFINGSQEGNITEICIEQWKTTITAGDLA